MEKISRVVNTQNSPPQKKSDLNRTVRISHIDALRGLAILLVVYSHSLVLLTSNTNLSELNGFFIKFRMPLFFFISGYFLYSSNYNANLLKKRTFNRLNRQFFPTLLIWLTFCILTVPISWESIVRLPFNPDKHGYWFTFVSVEYFLMFAPISYVLCKYGMRKQIQNTCFICMGLMFTALYGLSRLCYSSSIFTTVSHLVCLNHLLKYSIYFIVGILYKINQNEINKYVLGHWAIITYLCVSFYMLIYNPSHYGFVNEIITSLALVALIYTLTYHIYRIPLISNSTLSILLQNIGQMTLEIYLLHYFVIHILKYTPISDYLYKYINSWIEFPVFVMTSSFIIAICCSFVWILKRLNVYDRIFKPTIIRL